MSRRCANCGDPIDQSAADTVSLLETCAFCGFGTVPPKASGYWLRLIVLSAAIFGSLLIPVSRHQSQNFTSRSQPQPSALVSVSNFVIPRASPSSVAPTGRAAPMSTDAGNADLKQSRSELPVPPLAIHRSTPSWLFTVNAIVPDVQYHPRGTPEDNWEPLQVGSHLHEGDEVSCDPDGSVKLSLAFGGTVTLKDTTQCKIGPTLWRDGAPLVRIDLKMGRAVVDSKYVEVKEPKRVAAGCGLELITQEGLLTYGVTRTGVSR